MHAIRARISLATIAERSIAVYEPLQNIATRTRRCFDIKLMAAFVATGAGGAALGSCERMPTTMGQLELGGKLHQARRDRGASVEQIASEIGVTASELRAYETGERCLPHHMLQQLSRALGRPTGWFLSCRA